MKYGFPQGSVLGPSLFSIYVYPLPSIISKYPNILTSYADDIQLYMFLPTNSSQDINNKLSNCANDIKEWIIYNNILLKGLMHQIVCIKNYIESFTISYVLSSFSY